MVEGEVKSYLCQHGYADVAVMSEQDRTWVSVADHCMGFNGPLSELTERDLQEFAYRAEGRAHG